MSAARWLVLGSHVPEEGGLGGIVRYTVEVTRALAERDDIMVHVHCRPAAVPFFVDELGIAPERLHPTARGSAVTDSVWEVMAGGTLAERIAADVVLGSKQLVPWRSGGARRVLTVHDMVPMDRPSDFGPLKRLLLPPAYRRSIRAADVLACVSEAARIRLRRHVPEATSKAVVVANGVTDRLSKVEPAAIPELDGRRFGLVVGDLSHRKNTGFVAGLWSDVVTLVPDAHLALIGPPGWGRNEDIPELTELVQRGQLTLAGRVDDGALRWAYEHARVTLCPSLLEGFGLPVVEALHLGCPVVSSPDPAQVEAAGGAATIIDLADRDRWVRAIAELLTETRGSLPPADHLPEFRTWGQVAAELVEQVGLEGSVRAG